MSLRPTILLLLAVALAAPGCGGGAVPSAEDAGGDAGTRDAGSIPDGAPRDTGGAEDAWSAMDGALPDGSSGGDDAAMRDDATAADDASSTDDAGSGDAWVDLPDVAIPDSGIAACSIGWSRCGDTCRDLTSDSEACGACDRDCHGPHAFGAACTGSACIVTACDIGYADVNGLADDGCEAMQDFAITLDSPTVVVSASGSATVGVTIDRINGFFAQINSTVTGLPATVFPTPALTPAPETRAVIQLDASATATPGTFTVMVTAGASIAGTVFQHSVPLTVQVVSTPVRVTSVEVLRAGVPLPANQVPQGMTPLTLRVRGSGLLAVTSAGLDMLTLTDVAGATDTQREYEFGVPHGFSTGIGIRALDLVLRVAGGAAGASVARAVSVTDIWVDPAGNDVSGVGTAMSPLQTIDRAFGVASAGDSVWLTGTLAPAAVPAPSGVAQVRGVADVVCTPSADVGLEASTSLRVEGLHFVACDVALRVDDGSVGTTVASGVRIEQTRQPFDIASPGTLPLRVTGSTLAGPSTGGTMRLTHGRVQLVRSSLENVRVEGAGASLAIDTCDIYVDVGDAVVVGPSPEDSSIRGSTLTAHTGAAVRVSPAAHLVLDTVELEYSSRGLVVDGGTVTASLTNVHGNNDDGILVTGASPTLTLGTPSRSRIYGNYGVGLRVAPTSGTATLGLASLSVEYNAEGGIDVQSPTGVTAQLTMNVSLQGNYGFGLRIAGGTTHIAPSSSISGTQTAASDTLVQLVSGDGSLAFTSGTWTLPLGSGISIEAASRHTVLLGDASRSLVIDLSYHRYDAHFGIIDDRGTAGTATSARVAFVGSDGLPRTWSGVYTNTGSYSASVSPRDYASWLVAHAGRIDFGAP